MTRKPSKVSSIFIGGLTTSAKFLCTFNNPSAFIQATSYGRAQSLVGCIVAGFGLGIVSIVIPIWFSNLVIASWLDYSVSLYYSSIQLRPPCEFQGVFAIQWSDSESQPCTCCSPWSDDVKYAIAVESQEVSIWSDVFKDHGVGG
ncbi:hypothetical protein LIPSTDRAFT_104973 [Lipomyces starkeyi NRRL Y-11557]|uniref:Uncharacterized protein n=1 Tax=Lipomyces starkeyi NRRL Y-11557 TaxID=675824 RepID=A0A1E3Q425_LIPST|nr:hypothetical protein LIPSTDRAFT_104973 [Lipomyces starkeyi NRRL Y-11557]